MSEFLDPVVIRVKADLGDTLIKLRAVRDAIKEIRGGTANIRIKQEFDKAAVAAAAVAKSVKEADRATGDAERTTRRFGDSWRRLFQDIHKGVHDIHGGFFRNLLGGVHGAFRNLDSAFKDTFRAVKDVGKALGGVFDVMLGIGQEGMTVGKAFGQVGSAMVGVVAEASAMLPVLVAVGVVIAALILPVGALVSGLLAATGALTAGAIGIGALLAVGIPAAKSMFSSLTALHTATQQYREASNNLNIALKTSKQDMAQYRTVLSDVNQPLKGAVKLLRDGNVQWQHLSASQRRSVVALSENKQALKDMSPAMKAALTALMAQKAAWDHLTPSQRKFANSLSGISREWHQVQNAAKPTLTLLLNDLAKLAKDALPLVTPLIKATGNAIHGLLQRADHFVKSEKFKQWIHQVVLEIPGVIREVGRFISKLLGLVGPLVTNKKNLKDLHDTLQTVYNITKTVLAIIARLDTAFHHAATVLHPLIAAISKVNSLLSGMGGLAGAAGRALSSLVPGLGTIGSLAGKLFGFESGTPGAPPGWAWTGEKGPELVKMTGGEVVIPHGPSMAMARGYANGTPGAAEAYGGNTQPINVYIDGKKLFSIMQGRTLKYNVNNNVRAGGRVTGAMAPNR